MSTENNTKKIVDDVAGAGTTDKVAGQAKEFAGKAERTVGDITDNPELEAKGEAKVVEGKTQRTVGTLEAVTHGVIDAVADGAHKLGDAVKHLIHHDEKKD